jgi:glycolate oxidase FAD binding subunit
MNSSYEVSAAAHLPGNIAARSTVAMVTGAGTSITAIRVEGPAPSVDARCKALRDLLGSFGDLEELHTSNSRALWREISNVEYFKAPIAGHETTDQDTADQVWRISTSPSTGANVARQIIDEVGGEALFDWSGGQIWLAIPAKSDAAQSTIRNAVAQNGGGHATLIRASEDVRKSTDVFHPVDPVLKALNDRVKDSFDPKNILNPGRMST